MVWITRIDFAGFGSLSGEKLEFEERKLNLVLESDSAGKNHRYLVPCVRLFLTLPLCEKVYQER